MSTKLNFEDLILVKAMYNEKLSRAILKRDTETVVEVMRKIIQPMEYDWCNIDFDNINVEELRTKHEQDIAEFIELYNQACYEEQEN